ncbi:hypothetical protein BC332_15081 [Capsicum chinense]|nr:hypothetical protein BC332_15081 [Capsicum chinense]
MDNYTTHVWIFITKPQILYHDDGYYIFKFAMISDRDLVMQSGPYTYRNRLVILRNWLINFEFNPEYLNKVLLWIKFPSLSLRYWSSKALSKLVSVVGRLMYTDKYIIAMERISYARVLVVADSSHTLPKRRWKAKEQEENQPDQAEIVQTSRDRTHTKIDQAKDMVDNVQPCTIMNVNLTPDSPSHSAEDRFIQRKGKETRANTVRIPLAVAFNSNPHDCLFIEH